jgi:hypothetical protein
MKYRNIILVVLMSIAQFLGENAFAQQSLNQINIVSFTVKNKLPIDVSNWANTPGSLMLVAQKNPTVQIPGIKLVLQIKQNGAKVCGNSVQSTVIMDAFSVRNFTTNELVSLLPQCPKLTTSSYSLCVQFFNIDNYPISKEFCKDFMVGDIAITYNAPQNIAPAIDKKFTAEAIKAPITFRWTPVLPKPKEQVTYKLRVWQLMQGQTFSQAIKANEPLVEKDITNINQAIIANIFNANCSLPYLCEYVWNVQAFDINGKPIGKNNGTSEVYSFKIKTD